MTWKPILGIALLSLAVPSLGQIIPNDAQEPVEVNKARGEFARKLHGQVMPKGKGWKPVMDLDRKLQIMLPEKWKATVTRDAEAAIVAVPGGDKEPTAQFRLSILAPRDADPFDIDEEFALKYADDLKDDPQFRKLKYQPTDSGHVLMRGMKFALAGGTLTVDSEVPGKGKRQKVSETFQQEQLVYIAFDRLVVMQFTAPAKDFPRYAADVARIFASYQNLGVPKID
jgi:hypothetical protein